jgi:predicted PurR-regulated permease PerM
MGDIRWYAKYTIGLAGLLLTVYAMIVAKAAVVPLIIAILLAVLLPPVCQRLKNQGIEPRLKIALLLRIRVEVAVARKRVVGIGCTRSEATAVLKPQPLQK